MDELVQWLGEQLDHDEAHAKKDLWAAENATPGRWRARYGVNMDHSWVETESTPVVRLDAAQHEADALLVARFQPETIKKRAEAKLADIQAKRQTLAELKTAEEAMDRAIRDRDTARYNAVRAEWTVLKRVVHRDVAVYADRPGYREEWYS